MREWFKPASTLLIGLGLLFVCLYVYLSKIPLGYTYDGMVFASRIEKDTTPLWDLFHPHHLLYALFGRLLFLWGKAHGASWDGLVTLQFFDLMVGSLGVLLTFHLLVRETGDRIVAALCALGLAFTYSYWYFSTSPGVRILETVTPILAWYVLTYLRKAPPLFGLAVGTAHAFAVLGHQTNWMLAPAFLGGIWCLKDRTLFDRFKASLYYLLAAGFWILAVYAFIGRYACLRTTYANWIWWIFSYMHIPGWPRGNFEASGLNMASYGTVQAFLEVPLLSSKTMLAPLQLQSAFLLFQNAVLVLVGFLLLRMKLFWSHHRQLLWVGLFWLFPFVPFFIWWDPSNIEFWVTLTPPCWILMGLVVSEIVKRRVDPVPFPRGRWEFFSIWTGTMILLFAAFANVSPIPLAILVGAGFFEWIRRLHNPIPYWTGRMVVLSAWTGLVCLLFLYNFHGILPQATAAVTPATTQVHRPLLEALDWKVRVDDKLVLTGLNTIPFYIDRYQKRDYLNLHAFLRKYRTDEKEEKERLAKEKKLGKKHLEPTATPGPPPDPFKDLQEVFQTVWKHHRKVWVLTEATDEDDPWRKMLEKMMKLPDGQLVTFFHQYELSPVSYHGKVYFYEVVQPLATSVPTEVVQPAPTPEKNKAEKKGDAS